MYILQWRQKSLCCCWVDRHFRGRRLSSDAPVVLSRGSICSFLITCHVETPHTLDKQVSVANENTFTPTFEAVNYMPHGMSSGLSEGLTAHLIPRHVIIRRLHKDRAAHCLYGQTVLKHFFVNALGKQTGRFHMESGYCPGLTTRKSQI